MWVRLAFSPLILFAFVVGIAVGRWFLFHANHGEALVANTITKNSVIRTSSSTMSRCGLDLKPHKSILLTAEAGYTSWCCGGKPNDRECEDTLLMCITSGYGVAKRRMPGRRLVWASNG